MHQGIAASFWLAVAVGTLWVATMWESYVLLGAGVALAFGAVVAMPGLVVQE